MSERTLLSRIDKFLEDSRLSPSYFGKKSCGNSELVMRLRRGDTVTIRTEKKVLTYIAQERQARNLPEAPPDPSGGGESATEMAAPPDRALALSTPPP